MKKLIIVIVIASFIIQSCASLTSQTLIEPNKTFVLGEGIHLAYSAKVKNTGNADIEIFKKELGGEKISVGILKVNQKETYEIPGNTAVFFQNLSKTKPVKIDIELRGTTNLSMGYKENEIW